MRDKDFGPGNKGVSDAEGLDLTLVQKVGTRLSCAIMRNGTDRFDC